MKISSRPQKIGDSTAIVGFGCNDNELNLAPTRDYNEDDVDIHHQSIFSAVVYKRLGAGKKRVVYRKYGYVAYQICSDDSDGP